jgi:hypothetical protein
MKFTPWYLAALAPIAVAGCSGALMGHVAVLAVAIGIFVGTLSLGRQTAPAASGGAQAVVTQLHTPLASAANGAPQLDVAGPNKAA